MLLLLCFVLPLSRCTQKQAVEGREVVTRTDRVAYRAIVELQGRADITLAEKSIGIACVALVFFGPGMCLGVGDRLFAGLVALAAYPVGQWLFWNVFLGVRPLYGGILTTLCWVVLICTSLLTLVEGVLARRRRVGSTAST